MNFLGCFAGGDEALSLLKLLFLGERLRLSEVDGPAVEKLIELHELLELEELMQFGDPIGLV